MSKRGRKPKGDKKFQPRTGSRIQKLSNWHESLSDWLIANPGRKLSEAAAAFNVTPSWISSVLNSDLFKEYHKKRHDEHAERVSVETQDRLRAVTDLSLEAIAKRIEDSETAIPMQELRETAAMALKASGYGMPKAAPNTIVQNNFAVGKAELEESRKLMRAKAEVLEDERPALPAAS